MPAKRRVCVVVTARPSYSRVKTALLAIQEHPGLELQLVVAGSALLDRYGTVAQYVEQDGFKVARRVFMVLEGENPASMAKTAGLGLLELATAFDNLEPDVVVTIADRYETISTAIAAAFMNLPLAHIQGGEVTGSIDEKVRHAVTKLADLHFVSTTLARERVLRMGEHPQTVHVTGCPSLDLAHEVSRAPQLDFDPLERYGGVGPQPQVISGDYLVVMQHPVTTENDQARAQVLETLHALHELGRPTLWFWPNVDAGADATSNGIRTFRELHRPKNIHFFKNMAPADFLRLLYNAACLVGNSSVGIRECSSLGVPVVNIGQRQRGRERGRNVIDVEHTQQAILDAIKHQIKAQRPQPEHIYGSGDAGPRIAELLASQALTFDKRLAY